MQKFLLIAGDYAFGVIYASFVIAASLSALQFVATTKLPALVGRLPIDQGSHKTQPSIYLSCAIKMAWKSLKWRHCRYLPPLLGGSFCVIFLSSMYVAPVVNVPNFQ